MFIITLGWGKKRDRVRNTTIRKETKLRDGRYIIKELKFDYAAHIVREKEDCWEKKILEWLPI